MPQTGQVRTRLYSQTISIADGNTGFLTWRIDEDCLLLRIQGDKFDDLDPAAAPGDIRVQLFYQNEQPVNTIPLYWDTMIGSAQFPMAFKAPLLIKAGQTLVLSIANNCGNTMMATVALVTVPAWAQKGVMKGPMTPWQARTQLYAVRVDNLVAGGRTTRTLNFDRPGYLWAVQGTKVWDEVYATDPGALQVEYGFHGQEWVTTNIGRWLAHVGTARRPMWFREPQPVGERQSLSISFLNGDTGPIHCDIAFQYTATELLQAGGVRV